MFIKSTNYDFLILKVVRRFYGDFATTVLDLWLCALGFKAMRSTPTCVFVACAMDSPDQPLSVTPADFLEASMAVKPL